MTLQAGLLYQYGVFRRPDVRLGGPKAELLPDRSLNSRITVHGPRHSQALSENTFGCRTEDAEPLARHTSVGTPSSIAI